MDNMTLILMVMGYASLAAAFVFMGRTSLGRAFAKDVAASVRIRADRRTSRR